MSAVQLKRFLKFSSAINILTTIIILVTGIFMDAGLRIFFLKPVQTDIHEIHARYNNIIQNIIGKNIIRELEGINECTIASITRDNDIDSRSVAIDRSNLQKYVLKTIDRCTQSKQMTPSSALILYDIYAKKAVDINKNASIQTRYTVYSQKLIKNVMEIINKEDTPSPKLINFRNHQYVLAWKTIPLENYGYENYVQTDTKNVTKLAHPLKYLLISVVALDEIEQAKELYIDLFALEYKLNILKILLWALRVGMFIFVFGQILLVLMKIKIEEQL